MTMSAEGFSRISTFSPGLRYRVYVSVRKNSGMLTYPWRSFGTKLGNRKTGASSASPHRAGALGWPELSQIARMIATRRKKYMVKRLGAALLMTGNASTAFQGRVMADLPFT